MNPLRHTVRRAGRRVLSPRKVVVGGTGEVNAAGGFDEVRPNLRELAERKRGLLAINRKRFLLPPLMHNALLDGVFTLTLHKTRRFLPPASAILRVWTNFPRAWWT